MVKANIGQEKSSRKTSRPTRKTLKLENAQRRNWKIIIHVALGKQLKRNTNDSVESVYQIIIIIINEIRTWKAFKVLRGKKWKGGYSRKVTVDGGNKAT